MVGNPHTTPRCTYLKARLHGANLIEQLSQLQALTRGFANEVWGNCIPSYTHYIYGGANPLHNRNTSPRAAPGANPSANPRVSAKAAEQLNNVRPAQGRR